MIRLAYAGVAILSRYQASAIVNSTNNASHSQQNPSIGDEIQGEICAVSSSTPVFRADPQHCIVDLAWLRRFDPASYHQAADSKDSCALGDCCPTCKRLTLQQVSQPDSQSNAMGDTTRRA